MPALRTITTGESDLLSAIAKAEQLHRELALQLAALRDQHSAAPEDYCRIGNIAFDASKRALGLVAALSDAFATCNALDDAAYERRLSERPAQALSILTEMVK